MSELLDLIERKRGAVKTARRELRELAEAGKAGEQFGEWLDNLATQAAELGKLNHIQKQVNDVTADG